ncbi:MAG TPA: vanadium-dependent haloperoxidase [Thermoanaerobaculia bacterium]|nr:vanadium-dependent haloperoxidase [Thermoanaerobaculia bacterium]
MRKLCFGALCVAALLGFAGAARADVILDWNEVLLNAIRVDKTPPPRAARAMACVDISIYDAVNGILGGYTPYHVTDPAPAGASPEAAAVAAAHAALVALFPAQQATFDAAYTASLAAIPDGAAKTAGIAWGEQVATAILELRADDHSGATDAWEPPLGGGWWLPTPPALAAPLLPNWLRVTPWAMTSGTQFRQLAPPSPNSAEFLAAFREVKRVGRVDSPSRTAEQTQIALFWADGAGTETPPGHWITVAEGISRARGLSLGENARLFGLLSITVADAAIVSWDIKYAYNNWRPVTAIQHADQDGNPATEADPTWLPLIATPPFPSYSSGHSTFSGSSSRLLAHFFGTDAVAFSTTSDALPGVTRSFTSFSQAAEEAGQSRIYGGIHWQFDNQVGLASGRDLADFVFFNALTPVAAPSTCVPGPTTLCLTGGRFKAEAQWRSAESSGAGNAVSLGDDSGRFWFFAPDNTEVVVKVLDACAGFDRYWVFASGLTNVQVTLTVTDTRSGQVRRYFNPLDRPFVPVQDVGAFATCP